MLTFEQPWLLLLLVPVLGVVFLIWRRLVLPFPTVQRRLILGVRLLLFALIISALAGAAWSRPVTRQAVIFVGDLSASTEGQQTFMEGWINGALQHKGVDDQVGIVAVGRNALVEQSLHTQLDFTHFQSTPDTNFTDLASGLRLAAALMPADSQKRIVLLSDGQQNLGDALQEARLLQQEGIRLDIVPIPTSAGAEARIDDLSAPTELRTNERFLLRLKLYSSVQQSATLRLYLDQAFLKQVDVPLVAGQEELSFNILAPTAGFHTFRVTLAAPHDTLGQNNQASAFVNVQGPPRVLVIEGKPGEGRNILAALQATGIKADVGTPSDLPVTLDGLAVYSSVVLADVPAVAMGTTRMRILQAYVRDLGRGLVVSGGPNSYGVGGYAGTPLEETLPLKMDIPQHKDTPSIAVVLIIESLESDAAVNVSKEAAKGVISLLTPRDQVGISDAYGSLVVPMQHVTDRAAINKAIDQMNPNDPGSYLPDLVNAESVLLHTDAKIKHVILLGDGDATGDNYIPQALKMASEQITISTVATNAGSYGDLNVMVQVAQAGKGRFYRADDPGTIPQILLKETQQAARRAIIQESFVPAVVGNHPLLTGLGSLPGLSGYVATTPKATAQQVLISHLDDPVLAAWQYGLGRVVAWTSDASGIWTAQWIAWQDAPRWWSNLVSWTLPSPDSALQVNATFGAGTGHLTVDLPAGTQVSPGGSQQVSVSIVTPDLTRQTVSLQPSAPGRWEGNFSTNAPGAYLLRVTLQSANGSGTRLTSSAALVVPYSPEFRGLGIDRGFLSLLAQSGGGSLLGPEAYTAAFASNLQPVAAALPLAFWLLALAALLLPLDIALRRLANLEALGLGLRWLKNLVSGRRPQLALQGQGSATSGPETALGATLGSLRSRREERRAQQGVVETRQAQAVPPKVSPTSQPVAPPKISSTSQSAASSEVKQTPSSAQTTSEQLLAAKRKRLGDKN